MVVSPPYMEIISYALRHDHDRRRDLIDQLVRTVGDRAEDATIAHVDARRFGLRIHTILSLVAKTALVWQVYANVLVG